MSQNDAPPDPRDREAFRRWLETKPREWSVVIAARAALRVLPFVRAAKFSLEEANAILLPVFRATAIARFAAVYPNRAIAASAADAAASAADAADASVSASAASAAAIRQDALALENGTPGEHLARIALWRPSEGIEAYRNSFEPRWIRLRSDLISLGKHWKVWADWYDGLLGGSLPSLENSEAWETAFTDVQHPSYPWRGLLPWDDSPEAVNLAIKARLDALLALEAASAVPAQSPAPVRVEERDGKIARVHDRDSPLRATERDFDAWREPVIDHIEELTSGDFREGTNHSRARNRLVALGTLLPGDIAKVKEQQFRIGYEIERFEGSFPLTVPAEKTCRN